MLEQTSIFSTSPEVKNRTYLSNGFAFAFLAKFQITNGHTLISPKRVVSSIDDLTDDEWMAIRQLTLLAKQYLRETLHAEGFNCAWNEGSEYGQSVPHFHLHIVPRTPDDEGITEYEPRKFLYRPGSREDSPENELASLATKLKNCHHD